MSGVQRCLSAGLVGLVLVAASGCAAAGPYYPGRSSRQIDQRAYDNGFVEGRAHGIDDARDRRPFDYDRHRAYRNADAGYRGYGDRGAYRSLYREGFAAGYAEGYRRAGGSSRGGYPARGGSPSRGPIYGSAPRYGSPAAQVGYRDGFDQGRRDRADRKRHDPVRASRYRSGDHDYDRRYGSRDDYKREYRAAFIHGYNEGYR
jgi:hypothetical protein